MSFRPISKEHKIASVRELGAAEENYYTDISQVIYGLPE
jgi:hypothetical protein